MNWDAIGAIGEVVGALAVMFTLLLLVFQMRSNTRAIEESNRLERVLAVDKHRESISQWRGRLTEHVDLSRIWVSARNDEELSEVDHLRMANLWIDFSNTQRANYVRSRAVGAEGLAQQAVLSLAAEARFSDVLRREWEICKPWHQLESPEFVQAVDDAIGRVDPGPDESLSVGGVLAHRGRKPGADSPALAGSVPPSDQTR